MREPDAESTARTLVGGYEYEYGVPRRSNVEFKFDPMGHNGRRVWLVEAGGSEYWISEVLMQGASRIALHSLELFSQI